MRTKAYLSWIYNTIQYSWLENGSKKVVQRFRYQQRVSQQSLLKTRSYPQAHGHWKTGYLVLWYDRRSSNHDDRFEDFDLKLPEGATLYGNSLWKENRKLSAGEASSVFVEVPLRGALINKTVLERKVQVWFRSIGEQTFAKAPHRNRVAPMNSPNKTM